ncbi:MAG TPA: PAS domain-containing protein, partial [Anaerolinea sp.]|nr:PAS domain-containing protein [Anaerolinea sp.]
MTASRSDRAFKPFIWITLYLSLYLAWLLFARPPEAEKFWTGSLALVFSGLVVTLLAWNLQIAQVDPRLRTAWRWIAIGVSLWSAGDLLRVALSTLSPAWLVQINPPDVLFVFGAVALLAGLLLYPRQVRRQLGRGGVLSQAPITTTATLPLAWMVVFKPASAAINIGQSHPTFLLYPIVDLVLLLVLLNLFVVNDPGSLPPPFAWITVGLAAYAVSDLVYAYLLPQGSYTPWNLVNFGWTAGDALLLAAIVAQFQATRTPPGTQNSPLFQRIIARTQSLLPLVMTLVLGWYTIIDMQIAGRTDSLGLWVTVVLSLALIGRQGILTGEVEFQRYASLVDSIAEPTFICNRKGEFHLVNPAFIQVTGRSQADELLSVPLKQIVQTDEDIGALLQQGLRGGWTGEVRLNTLSGGSLPVMLSLRPLAWRRGDKFSLAGTAHDLSEIKRQQAELLRAFEEIAAAHLAQEKLNEELEQRVLEKTADLSEAYTQLERQNLALKNLDQLKSDFVSLVSHELRAPLTTINSGIELVLARAQIISQPAQQTLTLVQAEILRLARFIETILDLSALDAGRMPIYPAPLDLEDVVRAIQRQMTHLSGVERIRWNLKEPLPEFLADERALTSVLFHLLDNALKYA